METEDKQHEFDAFHLIIIILSFYVLISLVVDTFCKVSPEVSKLLSYVDNGICFIFLYDFLKRFVQAENKWKFMRWGWIDLLSSIPFIEYARAGRILRLIRLLRIVRAFKSTHQLVSHVFRNRRQGALSTALMIAIMVLIFSSISILQFETDPGSNIKNAEDALWWTIVTMATVGYGDKFPVTTEGRLIGAVVMIVGIGLFGTFSGFIASWIAGQQPAPSETAESTEPKS
jgi:voltage-gated potassium channel